MARYHSNMLIWCKRNISYYYLCCKQFLLFLWKPWCIFFSGIL